MSDLFNENGSENLNETVNEDASQPKNNTEPVQPENNSEPINYEATVEPPIVENQTQRPPQGNENFPYGSQNFNNRYYGSAPFTPNQGNPNGAYNPNYNTPNYNNPNYNAPNYNNPNYNVPPTPPAPKSRPSGHKKGGIAIFIVAIILCLSVGITGIVIGVTKGISKNGTSTDDGTKMTLNETPEATAEKNGELTPVGVHAKIKESSVGVLVYSGNQKAGEGSGVIMGADANNKYTYVITCAHVINMPGANVKVQLFDETQYSATVIGYDTKTDIGVLRIEAKGLKAAEFGDSKKLSVGEPVYAIGNPGGTVFAGSFTNGIVSAIARPVGSQTGYELLCIQHNAAINPGNSGGALVNAYGQIIGINSSKIASEEYEGMGFAVPSSTVKEIFDEIVANGYVTNRPKLGITYYPATKNQAFGMLSQIKGIPQGAIVVQDIQPDSSLFNTNVQKGDLIIKVNGKELESASELPELIEKSKVGDVLTLTLCRVDNKYNTTEFEVKAALIEDKGTTTIGETTTQPSNYNPFAPYGN
ncbi:MAG: trypsin-like peptidase domain-containing protein [Oscillospiraceae bacterium]